MRLALLREAVASARSQAVASALTFAVVAGMCVGVLLTTGRTAAAEEAALAAIDAAGTRSIVVRSSDEEFVTAALLDRLARIGRVESVTGFGPVNDVRNAHNPGGEPVASRHAYGWVGSVRMDSGLTALDNAAWVSPSAAETLGLRDGVGAVSDAAGTQLEVVGGIDIPSYLPFTDRLVVVPSSTTDSLAGADSDAPLAVVVIIVETPGQVSVLTEVVRGLLADADPQKTTIETSAQLATIRQAVSGELGRYGRETVLGILAVSALVVLVSTLALVMMRRKDFGRRRALGARRGLIVSLLLAQVTITAGLGALAGSAATIAALAAVGDPVPAWTFTSAVAVLGVLCALAAALPPAGWAARRDPLHELRVP